MHSEKLNCHRLTFHEISSGHQRVNFNHTRAPSHAELRSHPHDSALQSNFFNLIQHVRAARLLTLPNDDSMSKKRVFFASCPVRAHSLMLVGWFPLAG